MAPKCMLCDSLIGIGDFFGYPPTDEATLNAWKDAATSTPSEVCLILLDLALKPK